jgi:xanthine dehydrogenase accessory factor
MVNIFAELERVLAAGQKAVLARIIRQAGSAPRTVGTKMLITAEGFPVGTIGGGLLEHEVIAKAQEVLSSGKSAVLQVRLSGHEVGISEMLCGGSVDVYLEAFGGEDRVASEVFRRATELMAQGRRGALMTLIAEGVDARSPMLVAEDGHAVGELVGLDGRSVLGPSSWTNLRTPTLLLMEDRHPQAQVFIEPIEREAVLYLFGAGHVSTFVAPLAKMVGFRVCVIDDRDEFANRERFPAVDEILVCRFVDAFQRIAITHSAYVAIITRGHIHDHDVLRAALQTQPRPAYIGMIASLRKRDIIYRSLLAEGIDAAALAGVNSPIGVHIHAESPEEIAVSIVAELIRVRAQGPANRSAATENPP